MWNEPPKFCIDLEADWLIILEEAIGKPHGVNMVSVAVLFSGSHKKYAFIQYRKIVLVGIFGGLLGVEATIMELCQLLQ